MGAQKTVLQDTDISDALSSDELEINSEDIDGVDVIIQGSNTTSKYFLDSISLNITAQDNHYLGPGEYLSDHVDEPEGFLNTWDIFFEGLPEVTTEPLSLQASGDDQYNLLFVDGSGNEVDLPLVNANAASTLQTGDDDGRLIVRENETISDEYYFIISDEDQDAGERKTFALQYTGADASDDDNPQIRFKDLGSGATIERSYSPQTGDAGVGSADANIQLGGQTFRVWNTSLDTDKDFSIVVDLNGDGTLTHGDQVNIETPAGARVTIANGITVPGADNDPLLNHSSPGVSTYNLTISTPNSDDYDNVQPHDVHFNITASGSEVTSSMSSGITSVSNPNDEDDITELWTSFGARFRLESPTSAPEEITGWYPTTQRLPLLFVQATGTTITTGETTEGGDIVYYDTEPISVGSAILASEFEARGGFNNNNAILVGGPCANNAAAQLMGTNPANCADGFTPGEAMIKLYQNTNGRVAMLVAGYNAFDTRMAARVLANYEQWQDAGALMGEEVVVSGTSFTNIEVDQPAAAADDTMEDGNETDENETA